MSGPVTPPGRGATWRRFAVMGVLIVLAGACFTMLTPRFLSVDNLGNIGSDVAVAGLIAIPATFLIMAGHVDLSVAAGAALCGVVTASFAPEYGVTGAVLLALATGLFVGLLNGLVVAVFDVNSLIGTFAMMAVLRALATLIPLGMAISVVGFRGLGRFELLPGVGIPLLGFAVLAVAAHLAARGRIGQRSRAAADLVAGRPDRRWIVGLFVVSGLAAATVGLIRTSQLGTGLPTANVGLEILVLTAVLLGGGRLSGGHGSVAGTAVALVLLVVVDNGLSMSNVTPYVSQLAQALFLLGALVWSRSADGLRVGRSAAGRAPGASVREERSAGAEESATAPADR